MSTGLIGRSPDLQKLRDEGYDVSVRAGHLLVSDVPYVRSNRSISRGILVSTLDLANDRTTKPTTHVAMWTGEFPCDPKGAPIEALGATMQEQRLGEGLVVRAFFSQKPGPDGYPDYYQKVTAYVRILSDQARAIDSTVSAKTFPVITATEEESVFNYLDTASSRAGISAISEKLRRGKVGIVGLGGTGSYVLDLVAKTPVAEIHLYDGDVFLQHNAFRSPGAPSTEEFGKKGSSDNRVGLRIEVQSSTTE